MNNTVTIASYRGPIVESGGTRGEHRAAVGGLIQILTPWAQKTKARWIFALAGTSAADSTDDTRIVERIPVAVEERLRHLHYDIVSNSILWPLFHGLQRWVGENMPPGKAADAAWRGYREVNRAFADRIAETAPPDSTVVVHDYQLILLPGIIRQLRPDLQVVYFHHIPFASRAEFSALPEVWRQEIASSLTGVVCGFQARRWVELYLDFCGPGPAATVPATFVAPVHPDLGDLGRVVASDEVGRIREELRSRLGDRKLIARVDRADPMKNVLGGVRAFDLLLSNHPEWRDNVVFFHHLVPTRGSISAYRRYLEETLHAVDEINHKWSFDGKPPIHVNLADQRAYGLALLSEYDVLLVNPIREGMNLVAYEGPAVNTREGVMVLSREAGAYDTLGSASVGIDPRSDGDTAIALDTALAMSSRDRAERARRLRTTLASLDSYSWHDDVVAAASR